MILANFCGSEINQECRVVVVTLLLHYVFLILWGPGLDLSDPFVRVRGGEFEECARGKQ